MIRLSMAMHTIITGEISCMQNYPDRTTESTFGYGQNVQACATPGSPDCNFGKFDSTHF